MWIVWSVDYYYKLEKGRNSNVFNVVVGIRVEVKDSRIMGE